MVGSLGGSGALLAVAVLAGLVLGGTVAAVYGYFRRQKLELDAEVEDAVADDHEVVDSEDPGDLVELEPINVSSSLTGLVRTWRRRAKEQRLAEKGYVKWLRLDSRLEPAKWVKPDYRGTGAGEYHGEDGVTYLFEKDAMVPDSQTGAWVALHRVGEADPINLRDAAFPALPADRVEEILNLLAEAEKPGFFDNLDISGGQAFILITVVLFLVYAATQVL